MLRLTARTAVVDDNFVPHGGCPRRVERGVLRAVFVATASPHRRAKPSRGVSVGQEPSDRYDEAVDSRGEGGQPGNTASYPHRPLRFLFAAGPPADLRRAGTRRARRTPLEPARTPDGDLEPRRRATPLLACRQRRREAHRRSAAATLGAAPHTNDDSGHPHERLAVDDQDAAVPVDIYARPSPSQFSRPAAVAAATASSVSASTATPAFFTLIILTA